MIEIAENFIRARLPERDENVELINLIIDRIITDRDIGKVDDLVSRLNLNKSSRGSRGQTWLVDYYWKSGKKVYGIRLGTVSHDKFSAIVRSSLLNVNARVKEALEGLLKSYEEVCSNIKLAEEALESLSKTDPVISLFKSIPGVGPVTALTYKAVIDNPHRFKEPRSVGAYLGLTPNQYSSGESVKQGRISKCGSIELRTLLIECAIVKGSWQ
jgi:Transposase IS116/IS110/IS902 family